MAKDDAAQPTAAACIEAWNRTPTASRAAAARRSGDLGQMVAGTIDSRPACGLLFAAGGGKSALATARWAGGKAGAWTTSVGLGSEIVKRVDPGDLVTVVFTSDGSLRRPAAGPEPPTAAECVRAWNARPPAARLAVSRRHPRAAKVTIGGTGAAQLACRFVFALGADSYLLVLGVWGAGHRVTAWKPPRAGGVSADELTAMIEGGLTNVTVRPDGTLHLFR